MLNSDKLNSKPYSVRLNIMKLLLSLCLSLLAINIYAAELRFDGIDCTKVGNPPLQSRIIVTNSTPSNTFFSVRIVGGNPPFNHTSDTCIDTTFGGATINKETQSAEGYALYAEPFLYVFVPGKEYTYVPGTADVIDKQYDATHLFKFSMDKNVFILRSEEMLGNFHEEHIGYNTPYNMSFMPKITYQLIEDATAP